MPAWLIFIVSAAGVVLGGARLARDGDRIADRTGVGATWIGAILVAAATSLPEIATDVSAVRQGETDLALGDLFGSSMANMLILAVADLVTRSKRLLPDVPISQALVGSLAIGLTAIAAVGIAVGDAPVAFGVGWTPWAIAVGYVAGMRMVYRNRRPPSTPETDRKSGSRSLRRPIIGFSIAAAVILISAPFLARSAATLAEQWGISSGFFGMVFLAAATSLPESAVVFAAIRQGAHELAVGSLLGSNCFNMVVLLTLDVADGPGAVMAGAEPGVVVGALFAMLLMSAILLDLLNRTEHRIWYLEPGPALTMAMYAAGLFLTYRSTH